MTKSHRLVFACSVGFFAACGALLIAWLWWPKYIAKSACEKAVLARLKSPATAKFSEEKALSVAETPAALQTMMDNVMKMRTKLAETHDVPLSLVSDPALHAQAVALNLTREQLDTRLEKHWSDLYDLNRNSKGHPFALVTFAVDSQNSMAAMMRLNGMCAVEDGGVATVASLEQR